MQKDRGYFPLWRKITEWGWYSNSNTKAVFLHLLLLANWEEKDYLGHKILPGQCIVGRKKLSTVLGLSEQEIRTAFSHLKSTSEITSKAYPKFSIVTLNNFIKYLPKNGKSTSISTKKSTSKQPASNQQATTPKNYKHYKNDNNIKPPSAADTALKKVYNKGEGLNIYALINRIHKERNWSADFTIPDEILIGVCERYLRLKEKVKEPWPWFMKALNEEATEYFKREQIRPNEEGKKQGMAQNVKEFLAGLATPKAV